MEFMLLFVAPKDAPAGAPEGGPAEMKRFAGELASQGKLRRGAPLRPDSEAVHVRARDGQPVVTDGPFAESREALGGFWILDVASRAEAIEIARRVPHARRGSVEVHPIDFRMAAADPGKGTPYLYAFRVDDPIDDCNRAKLREMLDYSVTLKQEGRFVETAPLKADPPPARITTQSGKILVTDGPFAEAKDVVGGYAIVRAASRAEAIEIAKRYPHAKWGPVEVREISGFDPI